MEAGRRWPSPGVRGKGNIYGFFKRLIDISLSLLLLAVFSPVMLVTAVAVKAESEGAAI